MGVGQVSRSVDAPDVVRKHEVACLGVPLFFWGRLEKVSISDGVYIFGEVNAHI